MTAQIATPRKPSICGRMIFPGRRASTPSHRSGPIGSADKTASVFNMAATARTSPTASRVTLTESYKCSAAKRPVPGGVPRPLSTGVGMKTGWMSFASKVTVRNPLPVAASNNCPATQTLFSRTLPEGEEWIKRRKPQYDQLTRVMPVANRQPVNGFQLLFSEIVIFDSEAIWKIYGMNIWRSQSQLPAKSRLYRLFVMLSKASQTSRRKRAAKLPRGLIICRRCIRSDTFCE